MRTALSGPMLSFGRARAVHSDTFSPDEVLKYINVIYRYIVSNSEDLAFEK